jgi:flagellar motility protein MotE (MotC chaperone)
MADAKDKDKTPEAPEESTAKPAGKNSNLLKYALFGVGGLVAILAIAFGTLMLVGKGKSPAPTETASAAEPRKAVSSDSGAAEGSSDTSVDLSDSMPDDSAFAFLEQDTTVLDDIVSNLQANDYKPTDSEAEADVQRLSAADSATEVSWIEQEKARLTKWQSDLDTRQKELDKLDQSVSRKVLRIEQAESARVAQLAKLYDGMDAKAVANLLASLEDSTVVDILPRMKAKSASAVLQLMPPKRAARLSQQMITIAEN